MADNKKILIEIVTKTSGAEKKVKKTGDAVEKTGKQADKASKSFFGLGKTMKAIARGFIIVKSFQLLSKALTESVKILAEFELTMAKVKAITGATEEQFERLTKNAKELALGTMFTASQVGELQLAYAKLGFTTEEIEAAGEATLKLATITGDDLAGAADVVGATIRGFGLDAGEAARVVDVMAKSFTSSALNLEVFKQSMKTLAPIANSANIDLETTTALLGTLADRGIRGTVAATGLKNIFMAMSDPTSALANHLGFTVNSSEAALEAFKNLGEEGINLAVAQGLITKRAAAAFLTLADGIDDVNDLKDSLDTATGSANEMSEVIEDTLTVSWQKFTSAVQGYILNEGGATLEWMKNFTEAITFFVNQRNEDFVKLQGVLELQQQQFKGLVDAQVPLIELQQTSSAMNTVILQQEQEILDMQKKQLTASDEEFEKLEEEISIERKSIAINKERKTQIDEEFDSRSNRIEQKDTEIDQLLSELAIAKRFSAFMRSKDGNVAIIDDEIERLKDLLALKGVDRGDGKGEVSGVGGEAAAKKAAKDHDKRIKAEIKTEKLRAEQIIGSAETVRRAKVGALEFERKKIQELNEYKDASGEEQVAMEEDVNNRIFQINKKHGEKLAKENEKLNAEAEKERERVATEIENFEAEMLQMRIDAGVALMQAGFDMYQVLANNRMEAMARENEAEMTSFTDLQDEKLSRFDIDQKEEIALFEGTQEQKAQFEKQKGLERLEFEKEQEQAREALRKKQLKAENAAAKEAFKVEKANTIAKIAIQTALGIAQINANPTVNLDPSLFTLRALMTALITGTGAAQAAVVGAQKFQPKTFQDGGMIEGASHAEGGVPFTVAGRAGFEAEGGEYIFSKHSRQIRYRTFRRYKLRWCCPKIVC